MNIRKMRGLPLIAALIMVGSLMTLLYGYGQFALVRVREKAQELEEQDKNEEALAQYRKLAETLSYSPILKSHFREEYSAAMVGRLRLLYAAGKYDEVIELSESCIQENIKDLAGAYFWNGNSFFQKGMNEEIGEDSFSWFHRAQAQFRKGLESDTEGRWSLRYNYELIRTVIERSEKGKEQEAIKILRPPDPLQRPGRKVEG